MKAKAPKTEVRKYQCRECMGRFWVGCDDTDYPDFCPFCGDHRGDRRVLFATSEKTETVSGRAACH